MEKFTVNRDKKTFVFDDGEEIPIPKDKVKQVLRSPYAKKLKEQEKSKRKMLSEGDFFPALTAGREAAEESFLGNPVDTISNYVSSGIKGLSPGEGQENLGYIDRLLDNFHAVQEGKGEYLAEQEEKHPVATGIGKVGGMIGELGALGGLPASVALPVMGAAHSETSFLEPVEKGKELAKDAVIGHVLDRFFGAFRGIAEHKQNMRNTQALARDIEEQNAAEIQRAAQATASDAARFDQETQAAKQVADNAIKAQEGANVQYVADSAKASERIAKSIGNTPVDAGILGVEDFIENNIGRSAAPLSKEAKSASGFLQSVFKPNAEGKLTAEHFKKGMDSLDQAIIGSEGFERQFLTDFRTSVLSKLPDQLAESYVQSKWIPKILSKVENLENRVLSGINSFTKNVKGQGSLLTYEGMTIKEVLSKSKNVAQESAKEALSELTKKYGSLEKAIQSTNFGAELSEAMQNSPSAQKLFTSYDKTFSKNTRDAFLPGNALDFRGYLKENFDTIARNVEQNSRKYLLDIQNDLLTKQGVISNAVQKTPGSPTSLPKPPQTTIQPAQTIAPDIQPIPQMPPPQGIYQRIGAGLENLGQGGLGRAGRYVGRHGMHMGGLGALAHLAHIPVAPIAAAGAIGTAAVHGFTSPSALGRMVRTGTEYASRGIYRDVEEMASRYPSYHDGILDDPMERRSLVREIENNQEISLEQKAIVQSKINRGKPIESKLE